MQVCAGCGGPLEGPCAEMGERVYHQKCLKCGAGNLGKSLTNCMINLSTFLRKSLIFVEFSINSKIFK